MAAQVIANSIVLGLTLALMAIGLTLIYGILLVVNFAHGEFYMLGAVFLYYVTSSAGLGYWVSAAVAIVAVGVLGWVLEVLVFRRFHGDLIGGCIAAIALTIGIQSITWEVWGPRTRAVAAPVHGTDQIFGAVVSNERLLIAVVSLVTILALAWFIKYAKLRQGDESRVGGQRGGSSPGHPGHEDQRPGLRHRDRAGGAGRRPRGALPPSSTRRWARSR